MKGIATEDKKPKSLPSIAEKAKLKYTDLWRWLNGYNKKPVFTVSELDRIAHQAERAKHPLNAIIAKANQEADKLRKEGKGD